MKTPLRILHLEDDPNDAALIRETLVSAGFAPEIMVVQTKEDYLAQLDQGWEIILADYKLPRFDGMRALELFKEHGLDISFIIVSGTIGEEKAVAAMKGGASDYILKNQLARLGPAIERGLRETVERRERKQSEEKLLESEKEQQHLIQNLHAGVVVHASDTSIIIANEHASKLLGLTIDQMTGKTAIDPAWCFIHEDETLLSVEEYPVACVFATGLPIRDMVLGIIRPLTNDRAWVLVNAFPEFKSDGQIRQVVVTFVDITERKQAEEKLRASRQILEGIINAIPVRVFWKDRNLVYLGCNAMFARDAGFSDPKDIIGKDDYQMVWHDDAELYRSDDRQVIESGCSKLLIEEPQTTPEGNTMNLLTSKIPLRGPDGEISGVLGTYLDITERKQAEEDIRNLARFPEENPGAVMRVTKDGVLRYANPSSRTVLQLLGVRIGLAVPDPWLELIRRATANGTHETADLVCGERTFSVTAGYVPGRNYINLYANDITDWLRLQEQLRQAQKLESVGRLAGGVAHDFNNLLTGIISCTEFVIENLEPDSPAHKDLDNVLGLGYRATNLTRQLLAFSRSQPLDPVVLRPNDLIGNYTEMLGRLIGEDIAVELDLDPDLGNVLADPGQLEQVILNLAVNARDAMPGGGALNIQTENVVLDDEFIQRNQIAAPGPYILISVRDTGCGMDPETLSKMFDPFFTTKKQTKGTGLGMSTVYGIVAQHNGGIRAESTLGKGTEFFIYLPRVNEEPTRPEPQASTIGGGTETILVVEDDTIVRKITERYLAQLGYTVLSAPGGPEAIETANGHKGKIDLLLTDVVMPEMGGRELFDKLSAEREELKVLYMSGYTDDAIVHHGVLDKGVIFLNKPFQKNSLAVKVRRALTNAPVTRQHDPAQKPESPATILIIDDEETVREILTRVLRRLGHNVLPASGGEEGLSIYGEKKDEIDLVIVDINMPKMSGIEVAGRLRSINPKVTVIGSSGESDQDLNETKVKKIFDGFIQKPYGINMLSAEVSRILVNIR